MEHDQTVPFVSLRLTQEKSTMVEPEAWEVMGALKAAIGADSDVDMVRAAPPVGLDLTKSAPMMGIEAVVATIALPSLAFTAQALRDVIVNYLNARASSTIEITAPDGRSIKMTGPDVSSDRVLEILEKIPVEINTKKET